MYDLFDYKPTIRVDGGIKASTKKGAFGTSWWAKQWIAILESFDLGGRLTRGRSYARNGQVTDIVVSPGKVDASVQGSSPKPYKVTIEVVKLTDEQWGRVIALLAESASYAAKLLAGEMPPDIGIVFAKADVSLLPATQRDLKTRCSCPDSSNPCKHIAAVYYLLGEEFDRNPFLIFELRGMSRADLGGRLNASPSGESAKTAVVPLSGDVVSYWAGRALPISFGDVSAPQVPAAIVKRLGGVPFWRGSLPLHDLVAPIYRAASPVAVDAFVGQPGDARAEADNL